VRNLELLDDRCSVGRHEDLLKVIHDELVHRIRPERRSRYDSEATASLNIARDGILQPRKMLVTVLQQRREAACREGSPKYSPAATHHVVTQARDAPMGIPIFILLILTRRGRLKTGLGVVGRATEKRFLKPSSTEKGAREH
jgi:hypothetical protein